MTQLDKARIEIARNKLLMKQEWVNRYIAVCVTKPKPEYPIGGYEAWHESDVLPPNSQITPR